MNFDIQNLPVLRYTELCQTVKIDPNLSAWRGLTGLDPHVFDALIKSAFSRYAESIQLAPASEAHHHAGPGGLLIHTYEVITHALQKRSGLKLPIGASIAEIDSKQHLWTYGVFAACLLHDAGKLMTSTRIQIKLQSGAQRLWTPHDIPLTEMSDVVGYRIVFHKTPYKLHSRIAPTLFDVLPRSARAWMSNEIELIAQVCAHLSGDRFESGIIGEIAEEADMTSTKLNLQHPIPTKRFSKTIPLIERYLGFIRDWVRNGEIKLNCNGAMGWTDGDGHIYFVCRALAEKLIRTCEDLGINDTPRDPIRIYSILQEHGYAHSTDDDRAIWTVTIVGDDYRHAFTCLKMDERSLTVPTAPIKEFSGKVLIGNIPAPENKSKTPETGTSKTTKSPKETPNEADKAQLETVEHKKQAAEAAPANNQASAEVMQENAQEHDIHENSNETIQTEETEDFSKGLIFAAAQAAKGEVKTEHVKDAEASNDIHENVTGESETKNKKIDDEENAPLEVLDNIPEAETTPTKEATIAVQKADPESEKKSHETAANITADTVSEPVNTKPEPSGTSMFQGLTIEDPDIHKKFFQWLKKNLIEKTIMVNDPKAVVHIVEEGVFLLAPGIFKEFCNKHQILETVNGQVTHKRISKKFDRLKIHLKSPETGMNIWGYWAVGKSRSSKVNGRVIPFSAIYDDDHPLPKRNKYLSKSREGTT